MLYRAQIMLLDEPTNHLDVKNVAWLENYLTNLPDVTSVIVSHDSKFLDHVCQSIIHYENRKLRTYIVSSRHFMLHCPGAIFNVEPMCSLYMWLTYCQFAMSRNIVDIPSLACWQVLFTDTCLYMRVASEFQVFRLHNCGVSQKLLLHVQ